MRPATDACARSRTPLTSQRLVFVFQLVVELELNSLNTTQNKTAPTNQNSVSSNPCESDHLGYRFGVQIGAIICDSIWSQSNLSWLTWLLVPRQGCWIPKYHRPDNIIPMVPRRPLWNFWTDSAAVSSHRLEWPYDFPSAKQGFVGTGLVFASQVRHQVDAIKVLLESNFALLIAAAVAKISVEITGRS